MRIVRPVVQTVGGMGSRVRDLGRLNEVTRILVRHGLGVLADGAAKRDPPLQTTPARVVQAIQELGPTYVKLGQILSTRPDILPDEYVEALAQLQDDVLPIGLDEVEAKLTTELGDDWRDRIDLDDVPLATASIAQVHRGRLRDGREVVLKVQRPGIGRVIRSDLNILHFLARRLLVEYPETKSFDPIAVVEEFERSITAELDFHKEVDNMRRMQVNFEGDPHIRIPFVVDELTTKRVLCMEFLRGVKMRDARGAGCDMKKVADRYLKAAYDMMFVHGLFHGDLHPGNVIVLPDEVLGLIDFGMVGSLSHEMRNNVVSIMFALQRGDYRTIARLMYEIAIKDERVDYRAVERDTVDVMEKHWAAGSGMKDIQMGAYVMDLAAKAAKHGARVPTSYTMFFKAIVTSEGLAKSLLGEVDPIAAIKPYFQRMLLESFSEDRLKQDAFYYMMAMGSLVSRVPVALSQFLDDAEGQRLQLNVKSVVDEAAQRSRDRAFNRGITAAFAVTCALCGTLATVGAGGALPPLAIAFYVAAVPFAVATLVMVYRTRD